MENIYCSVSNALKSFRLCLVRESFDEAERVLKLFLKVRNRNEEDELLEYVRLFTMDVTGKSFLKKNLISKIVIEEKNITTSFNSCLLKEIKFPDINDVWHFEYDIEIVFQECYPSKKLYLSGPMSICKDKETWEKNFQKYEDIFTAKGYDVVNPAKNEILSTYEKCLKHSLKQEMDCDCIFFLPNSILSTGARLEYEIAKSCGLEIITLDEDISLTNNYSTNSGIKCKNG